MIIYNLKSKNLGLQYKMSCYIMNVETFPMGRRDHYGVSIGPYYSTKQGRSWLRTGQAAA